MPMQEIAPRLVSDLMRDFGFTREQASGIVGSLAHETGGFRHFQEIEPTIPGSRGGYGYAQWTGDRRVAFEDFAAKSGLPLTSYEANYQFLKRELEGEFKDVVRSVKQTKTPEQAAHVFTGKSGERRGYLMPGVEAMPARQRYAAEIYGSTANRPIPPRDIPNPPTPAMMSPQLASLRSGPMDLGTRLGVAPLPAAFSPNLNAPGYQPVPLNYPQAQRDIRVQGLGSLLEGERLAPNRVYNGATGVAAQPAVARAYGSATLPPPPAPTPYPAVQSASLSSRRTPLASTVTPLSLPPIPQPNAPRPATMSADLAARRAPLAASITPLNLPPIPQPLSAAGSAVSGAGASGAARGLAAIPNARQPVQQTMSASGAIRTNPLAGSVAMPAGVRPNVSIPMTARGTAAMATPGAAVRGTAVMPPAAPFPATMSPALAAQRQASSAPRPAMPSPQMQAQRANPVAQNTQRAISSLPSTGGSGLFQSGGYVFAQNPDGSFTNMGRVGSAGTGGGGSDMFSSLSGISRAVTSAGNGLLGLVGLSNGSGGYSGPISSQAARGIAAGGDPYTQTSDWWAQATGG